MTSSATRKTKIKKNKNKDYVHQNIRRKVEEVTTTGAIIATIFAN
jgi:hypothetical protein